MLVSHCSPSHPDLHTQVDVPVMWGDYRAWRGGNLHHCHVPPTLDHHLLPIGAWEIRIGRNVARQHKPWSVHRPSALCRKRPWSPHAVCSSQAGGANPGLHKSHTASSVLVQRKCAWQCKMPVHVACRADWPKTRISATADCPHTSSIACGPGRRGHTFWKLSQTHGTVTILHPKPSCNHKPRNQHRNGHRGIRKNHCHRHRAHYTPQRHSGRSGCHHCCRCRFHCYQRCW